MLLKDIETGNVIKLCSVSGVIKHQGKVIGRSPYKIRLHLTTGQKRWLTIGNYRLVEVLEGKQRRG